MAADNEDEDCQSSKRPCYALHLVSTAPVTSLGTLSCMPRELIDRIVELACRAPEHGAKDMSQRSSLALDTATTLNLALVSRPIAYVARNLLFQSPRITRPSALIELRNALDKHACVGLLIKNLHIGSDETTLPDTEWPLVIEEEEDGVPLDFPRLRIRTSFTSGEEARLPKWCEPGRSWPFEPSKLNCKDTAVCEAVKVALKSIDLEPYKRGWDQSGRCIGLERWATRIFELQGVLDLYLLEMRRLEDDRAYKLVPWRQSAPGPSQDPPICRFARCGHYPRLRLSGWDVHESNGKIVERKIAKPGKNAFVVKRADVWAHQTRRSSALDQFDHPILFARSGIDAAPISQHGAEILSDYMRGPHGDYFSCTQYNPEPHDHDYSHFDSLREDRLYEERVIEDLQLANEFLVPKLMAATTHVLLYAQNLQNLSLGGSLDICLHGDHAPWSKLRHLSLGPLLPVWNDECLSYALEQERFKRLESLRVCGLRITVNEARHIAAKGKAFPKLKRFQWEMVQSIDPATKSPGLSTKTLFDIVSCLQGQPHSQDEDSETPICIPRLIEVRLHPNSHKSVLALASPEQRSAWKAEQQSGADSSSSCPASSTNRVRLIESAAAKPKLTKSEATKKLHEGSRRWWDDCASLGMGDAASARKKDRDMSWMPNAEESLKPKASKAPVFGGRPSGEGVSFEFGFRAALRLDVGANGGGSE